MVNYAFNGSSKTLTHIDTHTTVPLCLTGNVVQRAKWQVTVQLFTTHGPNTLTHSRQSSAFIVSNGFVSDLHGAEMFCLLWVPVSFWINLSRSCQSCRQAGCMGLKRETHTERKMYSWHKAIWCMLWSQLPYSAVTAPIFEWGPQWNLWVTQETWPPNLPAVVPCSICRSIHLYREVNLRGRSSRQLSGSSSNYRFDFVSHVDDSCRNNLLNLICHWFSFCRCTRRRSVLQRYESDARRH